jgi:hypothetical protein
MSITTPAANAYPKCYAYRAREFRGEEVMHEYLSYNS